MVTDPQQQAMPPMPEPALRLREHVGHADYFTSEQLRAYAAEAVARALAASAPTWNPGAGKSQDDFGKWLAHNDKCMGLPDAGEAASAPSRGAVAWRWVPSEVWRDWVVTLDPKQAQQAREHGCLVEALGVIGEAPSREAHEQLRKFVDAAAGEGLILGGVDAADLFMVLFPQEYADAAMAKGGKK